MKTIIISIGEELTSGQIIDTNTAWLSRALVSHGVSVMRHVTVADELEAMEATFRESMSAADLVISTGGIGPTPDDLTRPALANALGVPLEHSDEAERQIRAFFDRWQRPLRDSNLVQANIPRGCVALENATGTAPGISFDGRGCQVFVLPGVPSEMKAMFARHIEPGLRGAGTVTLHTEIRCFGLSEAVLGERLADMMHRTRNPLVGTTASHAILTVRVRATACSENEARRLLDSDVAQIRARIGERVFGTGGDGLEHAVARLLTGSGKTVATAESCTGGLLAKRLTDLPGSSAFFLQGAITYSNQSKTDLLGVPPDLIESHGAVSEAVARSMAEGCRMAAGSDFGLAITGVAGPGGGLPPEKPVGLVFIAIDTASGCDARRCLFGDHLSRCEIRDRAAMTALDLLRLWLLRSSG